MEKINSKRGNIGRIFSTVMLAGIMTAGLAACGTSTDTASNPTATVAVSDLNAAPTNTVGDAGSAATPSAAATDAAMETPTQAMMETPTTDTSSATTPTEDASGTMSGETPTTGGSGADATPTTGASSGTANGAQINATLREWALDLSQTEVPAGKVSFVVNNAGQMGHNLTVLDSNGNQIGKTPIFMKSDGAKTLDVELTAGTYTVICSLPGHAARGQKNTLVVK